MIYRVWSNISKKYIENINIFVNADGELYQYLDLSSNTDNTVMTPVMVKMKETAYKIEWGFKYGGVDYFVGDIVCTCMFGLEFIDVVDNDVAYFKFKGKSLDSFMSSLENPDAEIKVIGNINENPELFKVMNEED